MIRAFLIALQFLTRVPVSFQRAPQEEETARSLLYYPLVGLTLGLLLAAPAWLLSAADLAPLLGAALLLCFWVALTGGLHLDGLADSADAWAGGQGNRQRMLAIMKDPYIGPIGMTAVALVLILKFAALATLLEAGHAGPLLIVALLGRTVLPLLFLTTAYVREGGLGSALTRGLSRRALLISSLAGYVVAAVLAAVLSGIAGFVALFAALAAFLVLRAFMRRQLGGTTGDTAGALVELSETVALVCLAAALSL